MGKKMVLGLVKTGIWVGKKKPFLIWEKKPVLGSEKTVFGSGKTGLGIEKPVLV